jgi:glycerol uptake facilitator-like aquaporin
LVDFSFGLNAGAAINPARDLAPRALSALAGWPGTFSVSSFLITFVKKEFLSSYTFIL